MVDDSTKTELARSYFSKAASQNYPPAIYNLAVLDDMQGNHSAAATGFLKAAKLMLPEAAYVKLCWALAVEDTHEGIQKLMQTPIGGDITVSEPPDGYLILQGGVPEMKDVFKGIYR